MENIFEAAWIKCTTLGMEQKPGATVSLQLLDFVPPPPIPFKLQKAWADLSLPTLLTADQSPHTSHWVCCQTQSKSFNENPMISTETTHSYSIKNLVKYETLSQ